MHEHNVEFENLIPRKFSFWREIHHLDGYFNFVFLQKNLKFVSSLAYRAGKNANFPGKSLDFQQISHYVFCISLWKKS